MSHKVLVVLKTLHVRKNLAKKLGKDHPIFFST